MNLKVRMLQEQLVGLLNNSEVCREVQRLILKDLLMQIDVLTMQEIQKESEETNGDTDTAR